MKTRFLFALKYLFFAFVAFTVPKMIVDSGRIVAPLEPSPSAANASTRKPRAFWPFRFLQSPPSAPLKPDVSRLAASDGAASDGATTRNYPDALYDAPGAPAFSDAWSANARFSSAEPSYLDGRADLAAPFPFADASPAADARPTDFPFPSTAASVPQFGGSANVPNVPSSFSVPLSSVDERSSFARFAESRFASSSAAPSFAPFAPPTAPFGGSPRRFEELFRFGHSPAWLVENWPRVDAVATENGLVGYRVAVCTGAADDDLAGVFACYFDATSERRVEFSGQTGDYRRLLDFMRREYGVALSTDSTAERFCYESTLSDGRGGFLPGRLVVRPTRVFLRGAEKSFFEVDVLLER